MTLPDVSYLRRLTSCLSMSSNDGVDNELHVTFLRNKGKHLDAHEKIVSLLLDEIHVQPNSSFKGGNIRGFARNSPHEAATTVQAIVISSILSKNKDVVSLVPVTNLNASYLYEMTLKVLRLVHEAGYRVVCLISDNNRINRNMKYVHYVVWW